MKAALKNDWYYLRFFRFFYKTKISPARRGNDNIVL